MKSFLLLLSCLALSAGCRPKDGSARHDGSRLSVQTEVVFPTQTSVFDIRAWHR